MGEKVSAEYRRYYHLFRDSYVATVGLSKWEDEFNSFLDYMQSKYGLTNLQVVKYYHRIWG